MLVPSLVLAAALVAGPAVKLALPALQSVNLPADKLDFFTDYLAQRLAERTIRVITSKEVGAMLGMARTQQLMGCDESQTSCMTELVDALGVDGLITGSMGKFGPTYQASLTVVGSGDARLLATISVHADSEEEFLARLKSAAFEGAAEVGRQLGKPTRRYPRSLVSADVLGLVLGGQLRPRYERALDDQWSMATELLVWANQPSQIFPGLNFTELDVVVRLRRHFFEPAPFGLFAGGGLLVATQYGFGTFTANGTRGAYGQAGGALTGEAGYSLLLFDFLGLTALGYLHVGAGHFGGVDSAGGVSSIPFFFSRYGLELMVGYAF